MKRMLVGLALAGVCAASGLRPSVHAQAGPDRYLVVFKSTVPADAAARVKANGGTLVRAFGEIGVASVVVDANGAASLARDKSVQAVGPERMFSLPTVRAVQVPEVAQTEGMPTAADALYKSYQWDMRRIGAPAVWARLPVSSVTPRVAVLDVGVMDTHPDLAGQIDNSVSTAYCTTNGPNGQAGYPVYSTLIDFDAHPNWEPSDGCTPAPTTYEFHGTHVAGTVAAKFGGGLVVGVAPDAKVGAYKVFDRIRYTDDKGVVHDVVGAFDGPIFAAIIDATTRGYRVVSMSLGGNGFRNNQDDNASYVAWDRMAKWANRQGVVVVAAAGNSALDLNGVIFNTPSDVPSIAAVSASNTNNLVLANGERDAAPGSDIIASYSNYGSPVDIAAPGGDCFPDVEKCVAIDGHYLIASDGIDPSGAATYYLAAGTSMATPHVSAVAAYVVALHPTWTPGHVRAWLGQTAQPIGPRQLFGAGLLDADRAVR